MEARAPHSRQLSFFDGNLTTQPTSLCRQVTEADDEGQVCELRKHPNATLTAAGWSVTSVIHQYLVFAKSPSRSCRTHRVKCDEQKPCSYCVRKGFVCKQPDFIVQDTRFQSESTAVPPPRPLSERSHPAESLDLQGTHSSYDVFRQAQSTRPEQRHESSPMQSSTAVAITSEIAYLLELYRSSIATWMDVLDHQRSFEVEVMRLAMSSPLLLHAVCALAAQHKSLATESFLWAPLSSHHYGKSIRLLICALTDQQETSREILTAATILLCSYELLAFPGTDYERHMYGARSIFQAVEIGAHATGLEHASFWVYARQDVGMALVHERATFILPRAWLSVPKLNEREEDKCGRRVLWLLAKMIELRFSAEEAAPSNSHRRQFRDLVSELDMWWEGLPESARGVTLEDPVSKETPITWFALPSAGNIALQIRSKADPVCAASACLYYHLAKILAYECSSTSDWQPRSDLDEVHKHCRRILSICLSPRLNHGAMLVAVNPLFYSAKYISSSRLRSRVCTLLENIQDQLGFFTRDRIEKLHGQDTPNR